MARNGKASGIVDPTWVSCAVFGEVCKQRVLSLMIWRLQPQFFPCRSLLPGHSGSVAEFGLQCCGAWRSKPLVESWAPFVDHDPFTKAVIGNYREFIWVLTYFKHLISGGAV